MRLPPGTRLGPYEVVGPLGAGGMGEVYRASDPRLGRHVAVKVLPADLATDPEAMRRFEVEARAVAALSHPNILSIYDVGVHEGGSYVVTELLEGETLRDRLARGPLPWAKAVDIGAALAEGIGAAHERGIVHRDLKPENVFLTRDGRVKILDFGLASTRAMPLAGVRAVGSTRLETEAGTILGTVGYMSPEQVRGERAGAPSDLFSLGCVLHEMLTGGSPFSRATAIQTLNAILESEPPPLAATARGLPDGLDAIVAHCLEKDPARRMQSARDLGFALRSLSARPRRTAWSTRRVALAVTAVVATIAVAAFLVTRGGRTDGGPATRPEGQPDRPPQEARQVNPEANDAYLKARYLSGQTTDAESRTAIALLERAVTLDPAFGNAHALLAMAYSRRLAWIAPGEASELAPKAFAAAERALALDPNLAEAYVARGDLLWTPVSSFANERAVQEYRKALALDHRAERAHEGLARVLVHVGLLDQAREHAVKALDLNPSNGHALVSHAEVHLYSGRDEQALAMFLTVPPTVVPDVTQAQIAFALLRLGRLEEAAARLEAALVKNPLDASRALVATKAVLLAERDPGKAMDLVSEVGSRKAVSPSHHTAFFVARVHAQMGRADAAVTWLREASDSGFPCYPLFAQDPGLDRIRQDPKFQAFLAEAKRRTESFKALLSQDR